MCFSNGQHCDRVRIAGVSLMILVAAAVPSWGQRDDRTASTSRATLGPTVVRLQLDEKAIGQMIARLNALKPRDVTFDANAVGKVYSEPTQWRPLDDKKGDLHIEVASALERSAKLADRPELLEISGLAYRRVIENTRGETRLRASSNYCAQLLRSNKPQEAVKVMEAAEPILRTDSLGAVAQSRSLYNYGKALQLSGDFEHAYQVLNEAVKADPTFRKAAQAAGDVAMEAAHETTGIPLVVEQTTGRLTHFDYGGAARILRKAMVVNHWVYHALYPRLLGQLVRYFTVAEIGPEAFTSEWAKYLEDLRGRFGPNDVRHQMIEQIAMIYSDPLDIMGVDPNSIQQYYSGWAGAAESTGATPDLGFLSSFIKMVGDQYYRQGDPNSLRRSVERYCHAWGLNVKNMEAALYLANVLLYDDESLNRQLDPSGVVLDLFIGRLFREKNRQYSLDVGRDWERILKCHIVLATIFERQGHWGPDINPRSAWFQWQLAFDALQNLDASAIKGQFGPVVTDGLERARRNY